MCYLINNGLYVVIERGIHSKRNDYYLKVSIFFSYKKYTPTDSLVSMIFYPIEQFCEQIKQIEI